MNNNKDQIELGKIISQTTELPQTTVDAFVRQLFIEIKNNLESGSSVNVEGLGIFRVIKSGNSNKILFLGSKKKITESIDPSVFKDELEGNAIRKKTAKGIIETSAINRTPLRPTISTPTDKPLKKEVAEKIEKADLFAEEIKSETLSQSQEAFAKEITAEEVKENYTNNSKLDGDGENKDFVESPRTNSDRNIIPQRVDIDSKSIDKDSFDDNFLRKKQEDREVKKKGAIILPIFIALLIIIAIVGVGYLFFENTKENNKAPQIVEHSVNFEELTLRDTANFSHIIIPDKDVSLEYIANYFYGNEAFWPYIYVQNEAFMGNSTIVSAGSIIKVPKLMINLSDYNNGYVINAAQKFGDEIKKTRKIY